MPRRLTNQPRGRQTVLAIAVSAALTPSGVYALELAQSPPGTKEPYVAPNVIISIDDSGSMGFRLDKGSTDGAKNDTSPDSNGTWDPASRRMNVLKYALKQVFNDTSLLPDKKIRLSWQAMWNNGNSVDKYNDLSYWYGGSTRNPGKNKTPGANDVGSENKNSIKILDATHRSNFIEFVDYLLPQNGTPSHSMFKQADEYLRKKVNNKPVAGGPWSSNPGGNDTLSQEFLGCRRNYHIMMTDGRWNGSVSGGNQEKQSFELPDQTQYTANSSQTRVYYDDYENTLADWAFYSWSNNLQPSIYDKNNVRKQISLTSEYRKAPESEVIGGVAINKYWNPKYNPANWPHLVTYTIGFSDDAITWPGASNINAPTEKVPFGYDGSFPSFVNGNRTWPKMDAENRRALDLWHAAINGRGRFYAVSTGKDLEKAFREIIGVINVQAEPDRSSAAVTGKSSVNVPIGMFTTSNIPAQAWKGEVRGIEIKTTNNGSLIQTKLWNDRSTAEILDSTSPSSRTILTWKEKTSTSVATGQAFRWSDLSAQQKTCFNIKPDQLTPANCNEASTESKDSLGEDRLNYLRGDRTKESTSTGAFRVRQSRQGDIVNSNVWYTGTPISNYSLKGYADFLKNHKNREPMIYVGGNDGMLHGFSTVDGTEKIAYIPRGVIPNLARLTWPSFDDEHRYFVDGSPMTGDIDIKYDSSQPETPDWRTMLIGTLGAGGKGYFVLDVTDPNNFKESNAASLVVMDQTLASNENIQCVTGTPKTGETACINHPQADMGHVFAVPSTEDNNPLRTTQITQLNNNRWGVIMGNGYNSKNGRPVLLIQYLDGNKELLRIPATGTATTGENVNDNGLSAPRPVDINNDGRPDVVYAGDLKGNMWKFLINTQDHSQWDVAFNKQPLFTARGGTLGSPNSRTLTQSITVPPTVRANDRLKTTSDNKTLAVGGMMIAFGTGRNVTTVDPENIDRQTLYSVLDNTRYTNTWDEITLQNYVAVHPGDPRLSIPSPSPIGTGLDSDSKQVLLAQQVVGQEFAGTDDSKGRTYWQINKTGAASDPSVNWNTQHGWYLDLPVTGERLLKPMSLYDGSNILLAYTQVPAKGSDIQHTTESCEATAVDEERQYLTLINIMDGQRPSVQLMDMSGDGFYDLVADNGVSRTQVVKGAHRVIQNETDATDFGKGDSFNLARMPEQSLRPNWRQLK